MLLNSSYDVFSLSKSISTKSSSVFALNLTAMILAQRFPSSLSIFIFFELFMGSFALFIYLKLKITGYNILKIIINKINKPISEVAEAVSKEE